jgi:hypothetical protein
MENLLGYLLPKRELWGGGLNGLAKEFFGIRDNHGWGIIVEFKFFLKDVFSF